MPTDTRTVRFGVQLPTTDGLGTGRFELREVAREAERLAFDSVWVGDHLALEVPVVESIVAATAAAAVTERVDIGFGVLVAPLRHPVLLAKQLSSLQAISGGRVQFGVGVGGEFPREWHAAGVPIEERGRRTDAFLDALPAMVSGNEVHLGPPWDVDVPVLSPHGPALQLWVGGRSDVSLARAVRTEAGWMAVWVDAARVQTARERLTELADERGVEVPAIGVQVLVNPSEDAAVAAREMRGYMEAIYPISFDRLERYTVGGIGDDAVERLAAIVEAGASTVILMPGSSTPLGDLPRLAELAAAVRQRVSATTSSH